MGRGIEARHLIDPLLLLLVLICTTHNITTATNRREGGKGNGRPLVPTKNSAQTLFLLSFSCPSAAAALPLGSLPPPPNTAGGSRKRGGCKTLVIIIISAKNLLPVSAQIYVRPIHEPVLFSPSLVLCSLLSYPRPLDEDIHNYNNKSRSREEEGGRKVDLVPGERKV